MLLRWHGNSDEAAVSGVQQAAARACRLADDIARQANTDQLPLGEGSRRGQAAPAGPPGLNLPSGKPDAYNLGVPGEDQRPPGVSPERDETAQFASRTAISQDFRVVDQHDAGSAERGEDPREFLPAQFRRVEQPHHPGRRREQAQRGRPRRR